MKIAPLVLPHDGETDCYDMKSLFGEDDDSVYCYDMKRLFGEDDDSVFPDNHPNQWPRQPSQYGMFADNSRCSAMKPLKVKKLKRKPARAQQVEGDDQLRS